MVPGQHRAANGEMAARPALVTAPLAVVELSGNVPFAEMDGEKPPDLANEDSCFLSDRAHSRSLVLQPGHPTTGQGQKHTPLPGLAPGEASGCRILYRAAGGKIRPGKAGRRSLDESDRTNPAKKNENPCLAAPLAGSK